VLWMQEESSYGKPVEGQTPSFVGCDERNGCVPDLMEEMDVSKEDDGCDCLFFLPKANHNPDEAVCAVP
jgi:hypothetical protein